MSNIELRKKNGGVSSLLYKLLNRFFENEVNIIFKIKGGEVLRSEIGGGISRRSGGSSRGGQNATGGDYFHGVFQGNQNEGENTG